MVTNTFYFTLSGLPEAISGVGSLISSVSVEQSLGSIPTLHAVVQDSGTIDALTENAFNPNSRTLTLKVYRGTGEGSELMQSYDNLTVTNVSVTEAVTGGVAQLTMQNKSFLLMSKIPKVHVEETTKGLTFGMVIKNILNKINTENASSTRLSLALMGTDLPCIIMPRFYGVTYFDMLQTLCSAHGYNMFLDTSGILKVFRIFSSNNSGAGAAQVVKHQMRQVDLVSDLTRLLRG